MKLARPIAEDGGRELLVEALAHRSKGGILVVDLPAPAVSVDRLLSAPIGGRTRVLWDPGGAEQSFAGLGVAVRLRAAGKRRFEAIRRAAEASFGRFESLTSAVEPVFVGGFAFGEGSPPSRWRALGEASFVVPRWRYTPFCHTSCAGAFKAPAPKHPHGRLTLCSSSREDTADVLSELEQIQTHLASSHSRSVSAPARRARQMTQQRWREAVAAALEQIHRGKFEKLVVARVAEIRGDGLIDMNAVLARLAEWKADATRFAFSAGRSTFLGLTPERLVQLRGGQVRVDALAGTAPPEEPGLLENSKDRLEHRLVVNDILERLGPRSERVWAAARPHLRRLPNVVHLLTPIRGQARPETHVLDLVEAMHPTPAVAGRPAKEAVRWIGRNEAEPRGWYAGPVGWFDRNGDGDFAVAIRSALIRGDRAWAFAGSGIVPGSDAAAEYAETALKLRPMLAALGAEP